MGRRIKCLFPPGYANEVGEAFRSLVPPAVVWLSYGVSSSYVLADAIDKGKKAGEVSVVLVNPSTSILVWVSVWPRVWGGPIRISVLSEVRERILSVGSTI